MKKLVCFTLALCLMAMLFAGCGGGGEGDNSSSSVVSGQPATTTPTPTPAPQTAKALRVTADSGLNVRAQASTDSEILGLAENGERLALMLEDPQNGWYQIQYEGQTAYVSADYAEVIEVTLEEYNQLRGSGSGQDQTSAAPTETPSETSSESGSSQSGETSQTTSVDVEDGE